MTSSCHKQHSFKYSLKLYKQQERSPKVLEFFSFFLLHSIEWSQHLQQFMCYNGTTSHISKKLSARKLDVGVYQAMNMNIGRDLRQKQPIKTQQHSNLSNWRLLIDCLLSTACILWLCCHGNRHCSQIQSGFGSDIWISFFCNLYNCTFNAKHK